MMKTVAGAVLLIFASSSDIVEHGSRTRDQEDFDWQVEQFIRAVSAPREQLDSLRILVRAVEDTLNVEWPGTKAKIFGSLSTGLGSACSDADVSVTLPSSAYDRAVLGRARAAFESSPRTYHHVHTRTRLPSITLHFAPLKISCDINFSPQATPFESDLLRLLLSADERALKLAIIVKSWAKLHKLISQKYLTSYGMMMLVVFFLQQRSILPPIAELQSNIKGHILDGPDQYNVAFERKIIATNNNESLYDIVGQFFEYYKHFDFDRFIVCPFTGQPVKKTAFKDLDNVPDVFHLYKNNVASSISLPFNITAVCVQSLLVHSDNCAWRVDAVKKFRTNFKIAAKMYRETEKRDFLGAILKGNIQHCTK